MTSSSQTREGFYFHSNVQFITPSSPNAGDSHECSWVVGSQSTRITCPTCALPLLGTEEKATIFNVLVKVLAEILAPNLHRRMLAKLALLSWTSVARARGINILGVGKGMVTYHLGVPRLQATTRIEAFWPDMPVAFEAEAIMEAIDRELWEPVLFVDTALELGRWRKQSVAWKEGILR